MSNHIYYKYRSLENFEYFVDILVNQELFATSYQNLNDAMEGIYYESGLQLRVLRDIKSQKEQINICSFSKERNEPLLWAHYANGSRGVNLGVEITGHNLDIKNIVYGDLSTIESCINAQTTAKDILTHKHKDWMYEKEVRVFTTKSKVKVLIKEIILGEKISSQHKTLVIKLAAKFIPNIQVIEYKDLF